MDIGSDYPALVGPKAGNIDINLVFVQEKSAFPVYFFAAQVQDSLKEKFKNLIQISEDYLTTADGKDYFRWEVTDIQQGVTYYQVFYFFESGDWKLVITYTRPKGQGSQYDAPVDDSMMTVRFTR